MHSDIVPNGLKPVSGGEFPEEGGVTGQYRRTHRCLL